MSRFRTGIAAMTFLLAAPLAVAAQPQVPRLGILIPESSRSESQMIKGLREELKQLRFEEKKNIVLEIRNANGDRGALQPAARDLVTQAVDVIVTTGTRATLVAKSATRDIPIVFVHPADPVSLGFVKDLQRPEANLTGVAGFAAQMTAKRLEVSREVIPGLKAIHIFFDANVQFSRDNFETAKSAAGRMGLQVIEHGVKSVDELKATIDGLDRGKGVAIFHVPDDLVESQVDFLLETARQKKLPTVFNEEGWVVRGALAAYGPDYYEMGRQAARSIDALLKGKKPGAVPVQRVAKFDLTLNNRTAYLIGLSLSREILKKANKVIR
jgi:putative ABC transport system substrate-binding protein